MPRMRAVQPDLFESRPAISSLGSLPTSRAMTPTSDPSSVTASAQASDASGAPRRKLSPQQLAAVRRSEAEDRPNLRIRACAGSGKTTTTRTIVIRRPQERVLYLVFNKANQMEAKSSFPAHVRCLTSHALAYSAIGDRYRGVKAIGTLRLTEVAGHLGLTGGDRMNTAWVIRQTMLNFCNSADREFRGNHVPETTRAQLLKRCEKSHPGNPERVDQAVRETLQHWVNGASHLWEAAISPAKTTVAIPHDAYLKLWALGAPQLPYSLIALDEAQDTNPCLLDVLTRQQGQLIAVGDRWQSIYAFRGAINAMAALPGEEMHLTDCFRFGPVIANVGNAVLRLLGETNLMNGVGPDPGVLDKIDTSSRYTVIARTNAMLCSEAAELCTKRKTAVIGGADEIVNLLESAFALYKSRLDLVKDPTLRAFPSWQSLEEYVSTTNDGELTMLYRLVDREREGIPRIIHALRTQLVSESEAQVVLTTAHKAKGREFDQVVLCDDFPDVYDNKGKLRASGQDLNLLYVASTRAKKAMAINSALREVLNPPAPVASQSMSLRM